MGINKPTKDTNGNPETKIVLDDTQAAKTTRSLRQLLNGIHMVAGILEDQYNLGNGKLQ